jgi:hypothetical protein
VPVGVGQPTMLLIGGLTVGGSAADYTPPPAPDARERLNRLRLVRSRRVGPATYLRLMAEHGHAEAALAALPGIARRMPG